MTSRLHIVLAAAALLSACSADIPEAPPVADIAEPASDSYLVGPGDMLKIFVWQSPELSTQVKVRPDGRISVPLIEDLDVSGTTPTTIGRTIETRLAKYVVDPKVTVIVQDFFGSSGRQVKVVGAAMKPQVIPWRRDMTVLDVVIAAGGLTVFADGNDALIVRQGPNGPKRFRVRLADLLDQGDITANVQAAPGDVLMIPLRWF